MSFSQNIPTKVIFLAPHQPPLIHLIVVLINKNMTWLNYAKDISAEQDLCNVIRKLKLVRCCLNDASILLWMLLNAIPIGI